MQVGRIHRSKDHEDYIDQGEQAGAKHRGFEEKGKGGRFFLGFLLQVVDDKGREEERGQQVHRLVALEEADFKTFPTMLGGSFRKSPRKDPEKGHCGKGDEQDGGKDRAQNGNNAALFKGCDEEKAARS